MVVYSPFHFQLKSRFPLLLVLAMVLVRGVFINYSGTGLMDLHVETGHLLTELQPTVAVQGVAFCAYICIHVHNFTCDRDEEAKGQCENGAGYRKYSILCAYKGHQKPP